MSALPRTARGRATRERILAVATEMVAERGVAATTLEEVCRAAPASKSQLYLYFADRDELLRAVARCTSDATLERQSPGLASFTTMAGIRSYFDAIIALQTAVEARGGCPIGTLAGQLGERDDTVRAELALGMERWHAGLAAGLAAMGERGEFRPGVDAELLATQVLALIQGGLLLTQVHRDVAQIRAAADGALELIGVARVQSSGSGAPITGSTDP